MQGKMLRQVLDKMLKAPAAQNARVQVCLPDGKFYDISSLQLMENKLIGFRESHRLVFTVQAETWNMGKVLKNILKNFRLFDWRTLAFPVLLMYWSIIIIATFSL
jgi:hypothetical protein